MWSDRHESSLKFMRVTACLFFLVLAGGLGFWWYQGTMKKEKAEDLGLTPEEYQDGKTRVAKIAAKVTPVVEKKLAEKKEVAPNILPPVPPSDPEPEPVEQSINWRPGAPVFIRVFKEELELELWLKDGEVFRLFETYPVAAMSGKLGPKLAEGDRQAPEGFYFVPPSQMKPDSEYHLAFNIGYPNAYDRAHDRTGSFIMVHGSNVSIGCFAMTDEKVEEIYTLCDAAHQAGQTFFRVHIFPFRMTPEKMAENRNHEWFSFWQNLRVGYEWFEEKRIPPNVTVEDATYVFSQN